jgi:ADP-ribose pyrophosphatase YjhB (NUDIX family)
MSAPIHHFRHCPACGILLPAPRESAAVHCQSCGFLYFFNPTVAAGAFLVRPQGQALFLCRAKDPACGKLALPGGFVEVGERAEESLRREIREEVGLEAGRLTYLCSQLNSYLYRGITYPVLDLFFVSPVDDTVVPEALDEVFSLHWLHPHEVNPDDIAFPSIRHALRAYLASA